MEISMYTLSMIIFALISAALVYSLIKLQDYDDNPK